jgi:methyl-accepting chemotaxis protein
MILRFYRRASVGAKLTFIVCVLAALIILTFTFIVTRSAGSLVSAQTLARIDDQNRSIATMIGLYDKGLNSEVDRFMSLFASFLPPNYTLDETQKIDINGIATPMMKAGDKPLNLDFTIPDQFLERSGAIATIFARSGDDFIRVTTSLKKQDGSRAIGTLLDRAGPAYAPVFAGKPYIGLAPLFGKQYITEYKPISDAGGRVIGALFVGVDVTREVAVVQQTIADLKLGEHGYYFVIDASAGPNRGRLLVPTTATGHPAGELDPAFKRML